MRKWVGAIAKVRFKSELLLRCYSLQPRVICYSIHFRSFCSLIYVLALRFFFRNAWSIVETLIYESFVENVCRLCRRLKNRWVKLAASLQSPPVENRKVFQGIESIQWHKSITHATQSYLSISLQQQLQASPKKHECTLALGRAVCTTKHIFPPIPSNSTVDFFL